MLEAPRFLVEGKIMKRAAVLIVAGISLAGCSAYPTQDRVLNGALVGGTTGAIIGGVATGSLGGAAVGAGIGAMTGALIASTTTPPPPPVPY
jgi:Glycine zipper